MKMMLTLKVACVVVMINWLYPHVDAIYGCYPPFQYRWQDSCYFFSIETLVYSGAVSFCEDHSSHLIFIESAEEQSFIAELVANTSHLRPNSTNLWIGLRKTSLDSRETVWLDGRKSNYTNFESDSFNDVSEAFRLKEPGSFWHDLGESYEEHFICESAAWQRKQNGGDSETVTFYMAGNADSLTTLFSMETFREVTVFDCAVHCYSALVCDTFLYEVTESMCYIGGVTEDTSYELRLNGSNLIRYKQRE